MGSKNERFFSKRAGGLPEILAERRERLRSINGVVVPNYRDHSQQLPSQKESGFDCINIVELVGDYVDGELSQPLHHQCQTHFNECGYCRRLLDEYCMTIALAAELRDAPPPSGVSARLRQALRAKLNGSE